VRLAPIFLVETPKKRRREQSRLEANQGDCGGGGCSADARSTIVARWRGSRGHRCRLFLVLLCCRTVFGVSKRKIEVVEWPRPGADHREQRVMAVEMAVVNRRVG